MHSKASVSGTISCLLTQELLYTEYIGWLQVYTDGSTSPATGTTTTAVFIPTHNVCIADRLNFATTSTTAELVAIWRALELLVRSGTPGRAVILTDSKSALDLLRNPETGTPLTATTVASARSAERKGWQLAFQWCPAHTGIAGNEKADALATEAHGLETPTISLRRYNEAWRFIRNFYQKRHPHRETAEGRPPPAIPRKLSREQASMLHRLRANCANTRSTLHKLKRVNSPDCLHCGALEDIEHVLLVCTEYEEERKTLFQRYTSSGLPSSNTRELLIPEAPRRLVLRAYKDLLDFLSETGLADRL